MVWVRRVISTLLLCSCANDDAESSGGHDDAAEETAASDETVASADPMSAGEGTQSTSGQAPMSQSGGSVSGEGTSSASQSDTNGAVDTTGGGDDDTAAATSLVLEPMDSSTGDVATTGTQELGPPAHEPRTALPTVRQEHGVVALDGEVYVLGGFIPDVTTSIQAYSPATDRWRDVAEFPETFHHPNVAVVDGILYVTGFHFGPGLRTAYGDSYAYDPVADTWTPRSPLPEGTERGTACVGTLGTTIYVFGGASDVTVTHAHAYDTVLDAWTELPPLPEPREHCIAAGIDGKVYIVSGRANGIQGLEVESWAYDPDTQIYEDRAPIPTPRGGAGGATLHGRIFVFGGEGNRTDIDGIFHEVEAYDPVTDTWESLPDMPIPRHGYGAATVGDRIYLPGGATSEGFGASENHSVFFFEEGT